MDTDAHHGQDHDYGSSPWLDMGSGFDSNPPHHSPPIPEYPSFGYGPSSVMPMEPSYSMSIPPPYTPLHLTMPTPPWPSMLTSQSNFPETVLTPALPPPPPPPPLTIPPHPVTARPSQQTPVSGGPTPRRTLTDDDRRRMCLYHEEHKGAKQTDIGALFGVERSTVSKVLRQKEKYLSMDDGNRSPIKRSKGRVPDIEKALSNWARNYQRAGHPLTDAMIREKAHFFATTCGGLEGNQKVLSQSWLDKFKQKNNLGGSKSRKNSVDTTASDTESSVYLRTASASQTPNGISPISPSGLTTPSPLSPLQRQGSLKRELSEDLKDLSHEDLHSRSLSITSPDTAPSLSASVASPTSPLLSDSPYTPVDRSRLSSISSAPSRPRSQTFPMIAVDPNVLTSDASSSQSASAGVSQVSSSRAIFDSPLVEELEGTDESGAMGMTGVVKRNRSNPEIKTTSMQPPPLPKSNAVSPTSTPGSPTQDEARRALELVMNYFQSQPLGLGAQEYITIGKMMEKLELAQSQANTFPGRLSRISECSDGPRVSKKRSIHTLN